MPREGFRASGVFCDIKRLGTGKGSDKGKKRDLALIVSEAPATVAGMFTTNQACAAPVKVCVERVKKGRAQAVVVNSGNANACTGKQGLQDALEMARFTEQALALPARLGPRRLHRPHRRHAADGQCPRRHHRSRGPAWVPLRATPPRPPKPS